MGRHPDQASVASLHGTGRRAGLARGHARGCRGPGSGPREASSAMGLRRLRPPVTHPVTYSRPRRPPRQRGRFISSTNPHQVTRSLAADETRVGCQSQRPDVLRSRRYQSQMGDRSCSRRRGADAVRKGGGAAGRRRSPGSLEGGVGWGFICGRTGPQFEIFGNRIQHHRCDRECPTYPSRVVKAAAISRRVPPLCVCA